MNFGTDSEKQSTRQILISQLLRITAAGLLAAVGLCGATATVEAQVKYDVIEIAPLAGSDFTQGIGIADVPIAVFNSYGSVMNVPFVSAGACEFDPKKPANGCNNTDMGVMGTGGLGSTATLNAVSRDGTYAVGIRATQNFQSPDRAFCVDTPLVKRKQCNGFLDLAKYAGGSYANALGITYDGKWMTGYGDDKDGTEQPLIWEKATLGVVKLERLNQTDNFGVSRVSGGRLGLFPVGTADQRTKDGLLARAVRWDAAATKAVEFEAPADVASSARAINLFYDVLGTTGSQPDSKAALWRCDAPRAANCKWKRTDFGKRVTTELTARMGLNDSLQAVGQIQDEKKGRRAVLWDLKANVIVDMDLNDLIDGKLGWVLTEANGINNQGMIVGTGTLNGKQRGYILIPK